MKVVVTVQLVEGDELLAEAIENVPARPRDAMSVSGWVATAARSALRRAQQRLAEKRSQGMRPWA